MLLDSVLGNVLRKKQDAPVTWADIAQVIKDFQQSIPRVVAPTPTELTEREIQFLKMMCDGLQTREIASALHIAPRTCETLRISIKKKTGAKNITQLALYCIKAGIVAVD